MVPPSVQRIDKFDVLRRLGRGGMGNVYLGRDPDIDRFVAIKLLDEGFDNEELRKRFSTEAKSASALRHPNIVTIFQTGMFRDRPFIVMEYIEGETFAEIIASRRDIPIAEKLQLLDQVLAGLQYAHSKGIVHRDIKPSNVMVDGEGVVRILDFGIARRGGGGITRAGAVLGTINYMAPEQLAGQVVDARADIFSAGLVGYELLTSTKAFGQSLPENLRRIDVQDLQPIEELCPGIDPGLVRVINRCLAQRADDRYADCGAVRRDLDEVRLAASRAVAADAPTIVVPRRESPAVSGTPPPQPRPYSRTRALAIVAATVAVLLLAGGTWRLMNPANPSSQAVPAPEPQPVEVAAPVAQGPLPVGGPSKTSARDRLRAQATDAWKRGDVEMALISVAAAAQIGPDASNDQLLAEFSATSRDRAEAGRRRALSAGRQRTAAYAAGADRFSEGDQLARQGQPASAVRAYVDAARWFEDASKSASPPTPVRVGSGVKQPQRVSWVQPEYPVTALSSRVQGVVILDATIGTDGRISDVRVTRSIPSLDSAAVTAVRQWVYQPTIVNGVPVPVIITVAVEFKLTTPQPIRVGGAIKAPVQTKRVTPPYPPEAQAAGVQGIVIMEATIGVDGKVTDVRVLRSIPLLDKAATDAVRQFEYTPTVVNGVAVPVVMTVTVNFTLTPAAPPPQAPSPQPAK